MEKRITLTIVLCVLVYIIWMATLAPPRPEKAPSRPDGDRPTTAPAATGPEAGKTPEPPAARPAPGPEVQPRQPAVPEQTFEVETEHYRCTLSNRGATIVDWRLKHFYTHADLKPAEKERPENWWPVLDEFRPGQRSLSVRLNRGEVDLVNSAWTCERPPVADGDTIVAVFSFVLPDGVRVLKELRFRRDSSAVDLTLRLVRPSEAVQDTYTLEVLGPAGVRREEAQFFTGVVVVDQGPLGDPLTSTVSDHASGDTWQRRFYDHTPIRYLAVIDKYFFGMLVLAPDQGGASRLKGASTGVLTDEPGLQAMARRKKSPIEELRPQFQLLEASATYDVAFLPGTNETALSFTLFAGPFRAAELEAAGLSEYDAVLSSSGYSMCGLTWIILPVSKVCKFLLGIFYALVHNYGIAILLLTLVVRLCMFPLTRKQMVSMHTYQQKIGKVKPELDRINQKYKSNPKRKQQEVMKLYKEHNISVFPMMGCLPLFVNIPVFFGLFHALRSSVELRHAPFVAWIKDLSAPDALITFQQPISLLCVPVEALNILPIIMGITWFAQMYFAPRPTDPQAAQTQKMMMFMPIMFMFMLYNYAAGLSLYWTFNSVLGLIEQRLIKRGSQFRTAAPPPAAGRT